MEEVMPRFTGPSKSGGRTSPGTHVRALYDVLSMLLEGSKNVAQRAKLRGHIDALVKAYPFELVATPSDIEQILAEEDGVPQDD